MITNPTVVVPCESDEVQIVQPPLIEGATTAHAVPPPTPEQIQAIEQTFAAEAESSNVSGLLGLWTSTLVLHDLFVDHLATSEEEQQREQQEKKPRLTTEDA